MERAVEIPVVTNDSNFQTANWEIVGQRWLKTWAIHKSYHCCVKRALATHSHAHQKVLKSTITFVWTNKVILYCKVSFVFIANSFRILFLIWEVSFCLKGGKDSFGSDECK